MRFTPGHSSDVNRTTVCSTGRLGDRSSGSWERIVVYYDNGQREITHLVNSIFNAHLSVEVRKVVPADYSLFQAADLCCTLALLRQKINTVGLTASERDFFSTPKDGAERALKKGNFKTLDRKRFGA